MRRLALVVVSALGCDRDATKPAPASKPQPTAPPVAVALPPADAATPPPVAIDAAALAPLDDDPRWAADQKMPARDCPAATTQSLAHALAKRWHADVPDGSASDGGVQLSGPNTAWLDVSCVTGTFAGKLGFFIQAWDNRFVGTDRRQTRYRVVVDAAGADLVPGVHTDAATLSRYDDHSFSFSAADLDGDGNDEALVTDHFEHNGLAAGDSVTALGVTAKGIAELGRPVSIRSSGTNWPQCDGKLTLEPAGKALHLVVIAEKSDGDGCPAPGRHVYALAGGQLAETK